MDDLWIGLHDYQEFDKDANTCSCEQTDATACEACRSRFKWVDGAPVTGVDLWLEEEPAAFEKCVRFDFNGQWRGFLCEYAINYVCSRGKTTSFLNSINPTKHMTIRP